MGLRIAFHQLTNLEPEKNHDHNRNGHAHDRTYQHGIIVHLIVPLLTGHQRGLPALVRTNCL